MVEFLQRQRWLVWVMLGLLIADLLLLWWWHGRPRAGDCVLRGVDLATDDRINAVSRPCGGEHTVGASEWLLVGIAAVAVAVIFLSAIQSHRDRMQATPSPS